MTHKLSFRTPQYQEFWPEAGPASAPLPHPSPRHAARRWTAQNIALTSVFLVLFASITSFSTILVMQSQSPQQFADYFSSGLDVPPPVFAHSTETPSNKAATLSPHTLLGETLHQLSLANYTNTYSQFHHLAAPAFQRINSAQKLRSIFSWMRQRKVKLSTGTILRPVHVHSASVDQKGFLNITGMIAARPQPVTVRAAYQKSQGAWKLFGIHVALQPDAH